jgi:hypothetical protein
VQLSGLDPEGKMVGKSIFPLAVLAVVAFALVVIPSPLLSQPLATEVTCPEKPEQFARVEYSYGVERPSSFTCWYKSPPEFAANLKEYPLSFKTEGKCQLKNTDEIADMMSKGSTGFSAGRQTCHGDRDRCVIICRPK